MNSVSLATAILTLLVVTANHQTWPRVAVSGQQSAVSSERSAVSGQQSAVSGQRSAVSSQRSAVSGQRSAVSGQRSAVSSQRSAIGDAAAVEAPPPPASQTSPATSSTLTKPTEAQTAARFAAVHLYIDPQGTPLAAYQIELLADSALVRIVGIEGGQHPAFSEPPYYDPAAMMNHRVIIAAFNTGRDLPSSRTRIATIHVQVTGNGKPTYHARLHTAGDPDGKKISPAVSVEEGEPSTPGSSPAGES